MIFRFCLWEIKKRKKMKEEPLDLEEEEEDEFLEELDFLDED